jgi:hypothetical protein
LIAWMRVGGLRMAFAHVGFPSWSRAMNRVRKSVASWRKLVNETVLVLGQSIKRMLRSFELLALSAIGR